MSNIAKIELLLYEYEPTFLCCTETRITDQENEGLLRIDDKYSIIRSNSKSRHSAGVLFFFKKGVKAVKIKDYVFDYNNILIINVMNGEWRGLWIIVYHSPNFSHSEFLNFLEEIIQEYLSLNNPIYITGDFNINMILSNTIRTYYDRLKRFERIFAVKQIVKSATRITSTSRSIIDLVFTNNQNVIVEVSDRNMIADHLTLFITKKEIKKECYRKVIKDRSQLTESNFTELLNQKMNDYDESVHYCDRASFIMNAIDQCASSLVKSRSINLSYSKRWFTAELAQKRQERDRLHKIARITNLDLNWLNYRQARNNYDRELKKSRNTDLRNVIIQSKNDQKKLWRQLKQFMNDRDDQPCGVRFQDDLVTDEKTIANKFNHFFIESIKEIHSSIPHRPYRRDITERDITEWSDFSLVTEATVRRIIQNFKNVSGVNNVNKQIIEYAMNVCSRDIVNIINDSFRTGIFPSSWKFTIVTPIAKIKGTNKANEFRPVNMPHILDKIIQTAVKQDLDQHISRNNLISDYQSAYRPDHSCETALNLVLNKWQELKEHKMVIIVVFIDLSRAFETLDRNILIEILEENGVKGKVLKWFKSWLENRIQFTKFGDNLSEKLENEIGVPQGTPLSSQLFILYINRIINVLLHCQINKFADDMVPWIAVSNTIEGIQMMNEDLERVAYILEMLKLKLNRSKTKYMIIGQHDDNLPAVKIGDHELERIDQIKYLGVIIDDKLRMKQHSEYVEKKMAKKVGFLRKVRNRLDVDTSILLYKTLIQPHYDYCSSILFLMNENETRNLQLIQNRALRIVLRRPRDSSVRQMLKDTGILSVKQRIMFNVIIFMYKAAHGKLPDYICKLLTPVSEAQPYHLRSNNLFRLPNLLTGMGQNSLQYKGVKLYNEVTIDGLNTGENINEFKNQLEEYVAERF